MKNITTFNAANNIDYTPESYVEYKIMEWKLDKNKAYLSLWKPDTAQDAFQKTLNIIKKNENWSKKLLNVEKENPQALYKIIKDALENNRKIEDQISLFLKQNASKIAAARVQATMSLWECANNPTYKPVNDLNENLLAA